MVKSKRNSVRSKETIHLWWYELPWNENGLFRRNQYVKIPKLRPVLRPYSLTSSQHLLETIPEVVRLNFYCSYYTHTNLLHFLPFARFPGGNGRISHNPVKLEKNLVKQILESLKLVRLFVLFFILTSYASGILNPVTCILGGYGNGLIRENQSENPELLPGIEHGNPLIQAETLADTTRRSPWVVMTHTTYNILNVLQCRG